MTHWADEYIGKPWVSGAQGPDAYDCGGLVRAVQRRFGIELPEVQVANDVRAQIQAIRSFTDSDDWIETKEPKEGYGVVLSRAKTPHHVGVWVVDSVRGQGGVLHAIEGIGVVFSDMTALRRNGWSLVEFYRHASVDHVPT